MHVYIVHHIVHVLAHIQCTHRHTCTHFMCTLTFNVKQRFSENQPKGRQQSYYQHFDCSSPPQGNND